MKTNFVRSYRVGQRTPDLAILEALDFEDYCKEAIRIQDVHKRITFLTRPSSSSLPGALPISQPGQNTDAMDWEPTQVNAAQANEKRRAKWVSLEEINRRKTNRLCIRCGMSSHMIRNCPYAPARRPQPTKPVPIATTAFEEPQLEEEEKVSEN